MKIEKVEPKFSIETDDAYLRLWKIGRSLYLDDGFIVTIKGVKSIRAFAKALLAEVGE